MPVIFWRYGRTLYIYGFPVIPLGVLRGKAMKKNSKNISKTRFRAIEGVSSHRRTLEPIEPIAAIDLHSTGQNKGLL